MSIKQSFISLQEYYKDLSSLLDSHVVNLAESFSKESLLSQSEVAAIRKPDQQKTKADRFLDIIINKVKNDSDDCFDKLVAYMKNSKDPTLLNLANKMSPNQQNIDNGQYRQPVQTESAPSSPPTLMEYEKCHYQQCPTETQTDKASEELVANSVSTFPKRPVPDEKCLDVWSESHLLNCVIQKAEKENCLIQIRFSTVSCTGLPGAGKTSFCNVLMGKRTRPVPPGNTHTIFIKKPSKHPSHEEPKWMEINLENLIEIIDQLGSNKESSSKESEITNVNEKWELLFLLDYNIPSSALNLLQPSLVTFVTYKMLGQDFVIPDSHHFIHNRFSKLVKELLSCGCIKRDTKYCELKIAGDCEERRMSYIAFVGVLFGSISDKFFEGEAAVINESLNIVKDNINCSLIDFPLSIWYVDDNTYLYRVKLTDQKDQNIEKIRSSLDEVVAQNSAYKIPNAWMIFYLKVCRLCMENEKSCILYNDALNLWKEECCSEDELHLALHYFHYVGVLFYFDTVEGMKDYVFTDCLWIFEKLSYLLCDFKDSGHDLNAKNVLKYEGHLQSKMIKQIKFEGPGGMKLPTFLNLLKHLKYIAPLNDNEYFIPGKLEAYEGKAIGLEHSYGSLQSQPMLITFSSGSLHRSIFCFLAAYIMRNLPQKWSKLQYKRQQHTFSDMITFRIDIRRYVCITDKIFFLEVKIYSKANNGGSGYHYSVYKFIQNALYAVCEELQLPPDECKFGFLCSECKDDTDGSIMDHMMLINKFKDEKDVSACCCKTNECSKLLPDHTIWFLEEPSCLESCIHEQATEESEATGGVMVEQESQSSSITNLHKQASSPSDKLMLTKRMERPKLKQLNIYKKDISKNWYDLGIQLLDDKHVKKLNSIQENHQNSVDRCCTDMFQTWLDTSPLASWNEFFIALKAVELYELITKIEAHLLTFTEHDSASCSEPLSNMSTDCPDGPTELTSIKSSSQEPPSESSDDTIVEQNGTNTHPLMNSSKASEQNSKDCSSTKVNTVQLSTCKTDPVCNYDQNEKQHCVLHSLSESATFTGASLILDNKAKDKKHSSDAADE